MLARILVLVVFLAAAALLLKCYQRMVFRRRMREGLGLPEFQPGRPAILYFTAPGCTPCETIQKPALAAISQRFPQAIQVFIHDAEQDLDLARAWGVLTVPTTFLIDKDGQPRRVNHGAVGYEKLVEQLDQFHRLPSPLPQHDLDARVDEYTPPRLRSAEQAGKPVKARRA